MSVLRDASRQRPATRLSLPLGPSSVITRDYTRDPAAVVALPVVPAPPVRERRYGSSRWKKTRAWILRRDHYLCWIPTCTTKANVADHIDPVYAGMPDWEFFAFDNLRASCQRHNTARGVAARLERESGTGSGVTPERPSRTSYSRSGGSR